MKVVLFCGGLGTRMREYSETIPKPMVDIGYRPLIWHLMKYYAHFGHSDFILCLGYRGDVVKKYFLEYNECLSNDFVLTNGGDNIQLFNNDIADWKITFVDTGLHSNIGQRLKAVERHVDGETAFMANYTDGLTNLHLPDHIDHFNNSNRTASFLSVKSSQSFHVVSFAEDSVVSDIRAVNESNLWINGGFFIFKRNIFDYMRAGEELVHQPFRRLIEARQLTAYQFEGFWASMDTFKEKQQFDDLEAKGVAPWAVWKHAPSG